MRWPQRKGVNLLKQGIETAISIKSEEGIHSLRLQRD